MLSGMVAPIERRRATRVRFGKAAAMWLSIFSACAPAERPLAQRAPSRVRAVAEPPGPAPRGRTAEQASAMNATCEGCHAEIAFEWRESLHAQAHTDPVYQRALAIEPLPFCQGCHAPEANPHEPVPEAAAALGVACVTCHVLGDDLVGGGHERSSTFGLAPSSRAPHPVVRDGRLGATSACAGCHEFEFPDRAARARPELMQSTVSEHARSLERETACADCHMPKVAGNGGHRSHRFAGGRDENLVRGAVSVMASRTAPSTLRVSLAPRRLGHAFPTGDLFRRVEVSAEVVGVEWQVLASDRHYLARHWERDPKSPFGVVLRTAVLDDRPLDGPVDVDLDLGERAAGLPIGWRVAYQRVEHPRSDDESDSAVEGEIEFLAGPSEVNQSGANHEEATDHGVGSGFGGVRGRTDTRTSDAARCPPCERGVRSEPPAESGAGGKRCRPGFTLPRHRRNPDGGATLRGR